MTRPLGVAALVLAVLVSAAHAEPVQITIAPPAEATTMDPIQAVTPTTVRIVTKKPDPLLLVRLAQMGAQILPARLTTDEGVKELARRPVGTGAYRFVEWVKDERLVMEANRDWWGWEGRPPAIDRVVWKPIPDDFPRIVALEKGEADIITNVPPDRLKALAEGQSTKIVSTAATRTVTFWINATQPPLSDTRVRQALHLALDVDGLVKSLYAGMGRPMSGGLADTDFGYNPALKPYPYDPATAKRLLAQAGRAGGIDVTLYAGSASTSSWSRRATRSIRRSASSSTLRRRRSSTRRSPGSSCSRRSWSTAWRSASSSRRAPTTG